MAERIASRRPEGKRRHSRTVRPARRRAVDSLDQQIGIRLRLARKASGITQEALAAQLGIKFQQVQKYETGVNRISASRLYHASRALDVPLSYFFAAEDAAPPMEDMVNEPIAGIMRVLSSKDGLELIREFSTIRDTAVRRSVIALVRSMVRHPPEGET